MVELILRWAKVGVVVVLLWVGVFVWNSYGCRKVSGNMSVIALAGPRPSGFERGDVVWYEYSVPGQQAEPGLAGRVIGVAGDRVAIVEGEALVNGVKVDQSYVSDRSSETLAEIVVPRDCLYILCDNRRDNAPNDSRGAGPIGVWAVEGKVRK